MHGLIVTAAGAPGSFARRVQESPAIAVDVLQALKAIVAEYESLWGDLTPAAWDGVKNENAAYRRAKGILEREYGEQP